MWSPPHPRWVSARWYAHDYGYMQQVHALSLSLPSSATPAYSSYVFLLVASSPCAISTALAYVRLVSVRRCFCMLLLLGPHTRRSCNASFRYLPNSQCVASLCSSGTYSAIDSIGLWFLRWKQNRSDRSAITSGFGWKWFFIQCLGQVS